MFNLSSLFSRKPEIIEITDRSDLQTSDLIKQLRGKFPVEISGEDLPRLDKSLPPPRQTTTRKFYLKEPSDKELAMQSTNEILASLLTVMGLRERLEFERVWFDRFGTHPDYKRTATLCAGSPIPPHNNVAMVFWKDKKLNINWCCPHSKDKYLRARRAL